MKASSFLRHDDEFVATAIHEERIPEIALLSDECWQRIESVCFRHRLQDEWRSLRQARLKSFCKQDDDVIRRAVAELKIADDFLADPQCWKRICQVRGRNPFGIDATTWEQLCDLRGRAHPPPGPY